MAFATENRPATKIKHERRVVDEKIGVLKDFFVVDRRNEDEIRRMLICAIHENPDISPESAVDRVAKKLIAEKLS